MSSTPHPFLKWVGGKRQLEDQILDRLPARIESYVEPFTGGGAVFFALYRAGRFAEDATIALSDIDAELVELWQVVRDDPEALIRQCACWTADLHAAEDDDAARGVYRFIRALPKDGPGYKPRTKVQRAARLLWLNRHCYNGLRRVNSKGQSNAPWCKSRKRNGVNAANLRACSRALQGVSIRCEGYREAMQRAPHGSVAYLDPPYADVSAEGQAESFTCYGAGRFTVGDQQGVAGVVGQAIASGQFITVVASNSDCALTRRIYRPSAWQRVDTVHARRPINSNGKGRAPVPELLVTAKPAQYFAGWDSSPCHGALVIHDADGDVVYQRQLVKNVGDVRGAYAVRCPHGAGNPAARLCWLAKWYEAAVADFERSQAGPHVVWCALEKALPKVQGGGIVTFHAAGLLQVAITSAGWRLREYRPGDVKIFATGDGTASKGQMATAAPHAFKHDPEGDLHDADILAQMARIERATRAGDKVSGEGPTYVMLSEYGRGKGKARKARVPMINRPWQGLTAEWSRA